MLKDFKDFIAKGNVIDLAVAVIIAGAFGAIVASLTDEIIMPVVGALFGGADFSSYFILLSTPEGYEGSLTDYAELKEAGAAMIGYGAFITAIINLDGPRSGATFGSCDVSAASIRRGTSVLTRAASDADKTPRLTSRSTSAN